PPHPAPTTATAAVPIGRETNYNDETGLVHDPEYTTYPNPAHDRQDILGDSYVITEDSYIEYLVGISKIVMLPAQLRLRLRSSLLFLGYALRGDWDMRAMLTALQQE